MNPFFGLALLALSVASATAREPALRDEMKAGLPVAWQKVVLDDMLQARIVRALGQNLPEQYFAVTVATTLSPAATKSETFQAREADEAPQPGKLNLDLSLLLAEQSKANRVPDEVLSRVEKVDASVILDRRVPREKAAVVRSLISGIVASVTSRPAQVAVSFGPLYTPPEALDAEDRSAARIREAKAAAEVAKILAEANKADDPKQAFAAHDETPKAPDAKAEPAPGEPREKDWTLREWVAELKYAAGMIIISVFAGLFALLIARGQRRLENRRISILEAQNQRQEQADVRAAEAAALARSASAPAASPLAEEQARKTLASFEKGIPRFRRVLAQSPDRAAQLVRQWIRNPRHGASEALTLLPQALELEELNSLFDRLGIEERKEWRHFLALPTDSASVGIAESFIASQVVDAFLAPAPQIDDKLRREIQELSLGDCLDIMKESPENGAALANILGSSQVARVFALLPAETASQITAASIRMPDSQLLARAPKLLASIASLKSRKKDIRFLENASELMRDVGPERENAIFGALADAGEFRLLESTARQFFPAELMLKLPPQVIRVALDTLPLEKRGEVVFSRESEEQKVLLNVYGGEGSRLREMVEMEMERIRNDDLKRKRVERNRNQLWKDFSDACRALIRKDENAREFADIALNEWLYERSGGSVGAQEDSHAA